LEAHVQHTTESDLLDHSLLRGIGQETSPNSFCKLKGFGVSVRGEQKCVDMPGIGTLHTHAGCQNNTWYTSLLE